MGTLPVIEPMKAVAGPLPHDDDAWAYEVKWDGMRVIASLEDGGVVMRTTRRADVAVGYPELADLGDAVGGRPTVLDGEVVAFDAGGRPSFARLAERMHVADAATAARRAAVTPVVYVVFDLLHFDGTEVWRLPYLDRRRALLDVVEEGPHWVVPDHQIGGGADLLAAMADRGMEGVVAKRPERPYEPGRRSAAWRKVKVRNRQEFVVGGWTPGKGGRADTIGSLMLGCHEAGRLRWVGNVGTGLDQAELARLATLLGGDASARCPFSPPPSGPGARGARWVRPRCVVEVEFAEWTPEGRLRHPVYLGERTDKAPSEVTCAP